MAHADKVDEDKMHQDTTHNSQHVILLYCQAWNEQDETTRRSLLMKAWADEGSYTDPRTKLDGREALIRHIGNQQHLRPGTRIEMTSGTDWHHAYLRFEWRLIDQEGQTLNAGIDFGELDEDGRLKMIVGFFGEIPAKTD